MEKKFTSLKLILSELEPDQDIDSSKKFQTSFFIFPYIFSMIDHLTLEGGLKSKNVRKQRELERFWAKTTLK